MVEQIETEVLVVGGGTGGTAAAIQAARRGANTILVSELPWLGGMLTAAGVTAPDGNELVAFQTGIWGAFLRTLQQRQAGGLDHAWVSFFTYEPQVGAAIFADWVKALPNLRWLRGQVPLAVHRQGDRITGVRFANYDIRAAITLDGTELGDLLALAEVPHCWGWEWRSQTQEPSAPVAPNQITQQYAVQAPTWVVVLQDFGEQAPAIAASVDNAERFSGTWAGYGAAQFLDYGRLPGGRFMINWPQQGNDYGVGLDRLISSAAHQEFLQEAYWHSHCYARFLQNELGQRYGLADVFPKFAGQLGGGAFALHPYYRESRRLQGLVTVREQDILPIATENGRGQVAALPINELGQVDAIAIGNYANDHHYPGFEFALQPKSIRWGGRWTGTPFALPYRCLVPATIEGLLVCEKNISVSHIANGATRLQPAVLGIGQAAGMAAALCIEQRCQPRALPVRSLQTALLTDPSAPAIVIPLFNLPPHHLDWLDRQQFYLDHPEQYPIDGNCPVVSAARAATSQARSFTQSFKGQFHRRAEQDYAFTMTQPGSTQTFTLVTLEPAVDRQLQTLNDGLQIRVAGRLNRAGNWIVAEAIEVHSPQSL
ncbi:FAD-dependent oxidoreductase [Phormidium tenue FACHB-886]|nr:FAD-dependent oxidoreductase [Phormidium tenue FACHB-886]